MRAAVRIVFDRLDLADDAVLVALEIDDAVMMLVTTTLVTVVIWPLLLRPPLDFSPLRAEARGPPLCRPGVTTRTTKRRPGEVGFIWINALTDFRNK